MWAFSFFNYYAEQNQLKKSALSKFRFIQTMHGDGRGVDIIHI